MTNPRIESEINGWLGRKGIINEQKALMVEHLEAIDSEMARQNLDTYSFQLDSGEVIKVTRKTKQKKKLDKTGLAEELDVEKSELNTPGMVKLAEDGILKEKHIIDHTVTLPKVEIKIKKRKPKNKKA